MDRLARSIRYAGNGLIALDAGLRVRNIHESYQRNDNWQRQFALEATGFGVGGASGILVGKATVGALTMIGLGATPAGWVVIIGTGVLAGYSAATKMDRFGKWLANLVWNR